MRVQHRRSFVVLAFMSACAVPACAAPGGSGPDDTTTSTAAVVATGPAAIVLRIPTGGTSTVSVQTLPDATCALRSLAPYHDGGRGLRVFSDDDGVARVNVRHLDATVRGGTLSLECATDAGARASHTIEVVVDDSASSQAPAPYGAAGEPTLAKLDRPAESLADDEIMSRHYPPRPDAATSPAEYAAWLDLVTSAPTVVAPHTVQEPERFHSIASSSNNWSGYVLTSAASAPIYAWIYGQWSVPRAYAESGFYSSDHSSFWVGIDGWGGDDVVQDGTDQDTVTAFWVQTSSYDAWTEWYPLSSASVSNFPVNPGDQIESWAWVRNAAGAWSSTPTVGWFYMWNTTQNVYVYTSTNLPSGATFSGHSAEWVLERPTVSGSVSSLANYSTAQMAGALAYDVNGGSHLYGGDATDTSWQVTMVDNANGNTVLSTVAPVSSSTMAFTFHNHE